MLQNNTYMVDWKFSSAWTNIKTVKVFVPVYVETSNYKASVTHQIGILYVKKMLHLKIEELIVYSWTRQCHPKMFTHNILTFIYWIGRGHS
jgi:hypothetical protein